MSHCLIVLFLGANLGPPGKPTQLDESYSPYSLISSSESPSSPLVPPDSWGQSKGSSDKMANGTNINWPPGEQRSCSQFVSFKFVMLSAKNCFVISSGQAFEFMCRK